MPPAPSSGLLLYRVGSGTDRVAGEGDAEAADGGRLLFEVLLFPRAAPAGGSTGSAALLEIPVWALERSAAAGPASRAGLPFEPRPRGEKPRLTAARTMDALLDQAQRSFAALTGVRPAGPFLPLGGVKMRRHRIVYVWACACPDLGVSAGAGRFLRLEEARAAIETQQRRFLDQLAGLVASGAAC